MARPDIITPENFFSIPCEPRGGWTLVQLRDFSRSLNLPTSGNKQRLCQRLHERLQQVRPQQVPLSPSQIPPQVPPARYSQPPPPQAQPPAARRLNPCQEFSTVALPETLIQSRRQQIFTTMLSRLRGPNSVATMTNADLDTLLHLYDDLFLQGRLQEYLQTHPNEHFEIGFGRTTRNAGYCQIKRRPQCVRKISISRPIHANLFTGTYGTETNAGLQCMSQLACLQLTLEHELIHLLVDLWCPSERNTRERRRRVVHGPLFKQLAQNLFGHRDFRHILGRGLAEDPAIHIARAKEYLRPGMIVRVYNRQTKSTIEYQVLEVNPRSNVKTFLARGPDGRRYRVPLVNVILPGETPIEEESEESEENETGED
jgi:hypothetical protein